MSDALDYLIKARPETMGLYFAFLKKTGSKLDPKTRNLISVITKVHAQTERGLKQYLKRALKEGCSGEEIIDALLMAFPALGLAKIVWATDVILSMNLPEFRLPGDPAPPAAEAKWHDLLPAGELAPGTARRLDCDGRGVFVYRATDGTYRVFDSLCPHQTTNIPHLALAGTRLTCPKHQWVFDLTTGACIEKGDTPLKEWPSRLAGECLQAHW